MDQIIQCCVECDGCRCLEIIPLRIRDQHFERDAGEKKLGYKRARVSTSWGNACPLLCPRCQNNLGRLDILRIEILRAIRERLSDWITSDKLLHEFVKFDRSDYTEKEVNAEAWKLIEKGIIQVDDKGILTLVNKQ